MKLIRTARPLLVFLLAMGFTALVHAAEEADEFATLLERLRRESPAEFQKVQRLAESDRASALNFLRQRFGNAGTKSAPSPTPSPKGGPAVKTATGPEASLPERVEHFEKIETLRLGEFSIDLCRRDDGAFGLGEIRRGVTLLRRADFLVTWQVAGKFPRFADRQGNTIHLRDPVATITFEPEQHSTAGTTFAGFRVEFATSAGPIVETASWEIGGTTRGLSFFDGYRGWHAPPAWVDAHGVPETNPKLTPSLLRGVGFQFEHGPAGALVTFHLNPGGTTRCASRGDALEYATTFNGPPRIRRSILTAAPGQRVDLWTRAFEIVHGELRSAFGLAESSRELLVRLPTFGRRGFAEMAEQCAEVAAAEGFSGVLLDTIWENAETQGRGKNLNTLDYAICGAYGGEAGLRTLVDACHRRGLRVIAWTPAGHLGNDSPVWRAHPDWMLRDAAGAAFLNPSGLPHGALDTAFANYWRDRVVDAVRRFGLDGLWMDTHLPYAGLSRPPDHEARLASLYRDFMKAGASRLLVEGDASAFGVCSLLVTDDWLGKLRAGDDADLLFGSSLVAASMNAQLHLTQFRRAVASGAGWIVDWDFLHSPKLGGAEVEAARREVHAVVTDWRRVRDRMQHRFVIADGAGYIWTNDRDGAKIVWLLRDGPLPNGQRGEAGRVYTIEAEALKK